MPKTRKRATRQILFVNGNKFFITDNKIKAAALFLPGIRLPQNMYLPLIFRIACRYNVGYRYAFIEITRVRVDFVPILDKEATVTYYLTYRAENKELFGCLKEYFKVK